MSVKLVSPTAPNDSLVKATACRAFRLVRYVQRKALQAPGAIAKARDDIASAWTESGANLPKKA